MNFKNKLFCKIFIVISGILFGFNTTVEAQYGAPENIYLQKRIIDAGQSFEIKPDSSHCKDNNNQDIQYFELIFSDSFLQNVVSVNANSPPETIDVIIFPNPCSDKVNVRIKDNDNREYKIKLLSQEGKLLYEWHINQKDFSFSMNNYAKGTYLLYIEMTGYVNERIINKTIPIIYK